jgi:regulator of PEP synthase PpsR (kinase-PPPase family)
MTIPPIYVVSGGMGASGEHLLKTALAQFDADAVELIVVPHVLTLENLAGVVQQVAAQGGLIAHTLVDADLRDHMNALARQYHIAAIDLIGPLLRQLARHLQQEPLGQPGLYRQLNAEHFARMDAINFAVKHDDGLRAHELDQAEIVLVGVSRSGKTPLSMYLSTQGWKTANVPLIPGIDPPHTLFRIDPRRVIGLDLDPERVIAYRRTRQLGLHVPRRSAYTDPQAVYGELEFARALFQRHHFTVVDITEKSIEESAERIIQRVTRRLET